MTSTGVSFALIARGTPTHTDNTPKMMQDATQPDPIRRLANLNAADCVPLALDGQPDFEAWSAVVSDVADDIEHTIRSEVEA